MMKRLSLINYMLAACILATAISGCGTKRNTAPAGTVPAQGSPKMRSVVYGIDITGSYAFMDQAFKIAANDINTYAQPGDVWMLRTLDNRSYSDRAVILTLKCPSPVKAANNPFDTQAAQSERRFKSAFGSLKSQTATYLAKQSPKPVTQTDVYGFFAKAGELLETVPEGREKVIIVCTDLGDTLNRGGTINLKGVKVIVRMFQSGENIKKTQQLKSKWISRLKNYGAVSVSIVDPSETSLTAMM